MNLWTTKPSQLNYVSQLIHGHFFDDETLGAHTDEIFADVKSIERLIYLISALNYFQSFELSQKNFFPGDREKSFLSVLYKKIPSNSTLGMCGTCLG